MNSLEPKVDSTKANRGILKPGKERFFHMKMRLCYHIKERTRYIIYELKICESNIWK